MVQGHFRRGFADHPGRAKCRRQLGLKITPGELGATPGAKSTGLQNKFQVWSNIAKRGHSARMVRALCHALYSEARPRAARLDRRAWPKQVVRGWPGSLLEQFRTWPLINLNRSPMGNLHSRGKKHAGPFIVHLSSACMSGEEAAKHILFGGHPTSGTIQRRLAWHLRKDDTRRSRRVHCFRCTEATKTEMFLCKFAGESRLQF